MGQIIYYKIDETKTEDNVYRFEDMKLCLKCNDSLFHRIESSVVIPHDTNIHIEFDILWESGTLEGYPCFTDLLDTLQVKSHKDATHDIVVKDHKDFSRYIVRGVVSHVVYDGRNLERHVDITMKHVWTKAKTKNNAVITMKNIKMTIGEIPKKATPDYRKHLELVKRIDDAIDKIICTHEVRRSTNSITRDALHSMYDDLSLDNDVYAGIINRQLLDEEIDNQRDYTKKFNDIKMLSALKIAILQHTLGKNKVNNNSSRDVNARIVILLTRRFGALTKEQIDIINGFDLSDD